MTNALAPKRLLMLVLILALSSAVAPALAGPDHEEIAYVWSSLPEDLPLAGHSAVLGGAMERDPSMIVLGGEAGFGAPGLARMLDLGSPAEWRDLPGTETLPRSRQVGRGLIGARAIFDADDARLLLVCDCADGQTFLLDLERGIWSAVESGGNALWYPGLVYDAARDRAILFGGDLFGTNTLSTAVWSLDLSGTPGAWEPLPEAPFALLHQAVTVDQVSGHILAIGGQDESGAAVPDMWRVDMAQIDQPAAWERLPVRESAPAPAARIGAAMSFSPSESAAFLYGGYAASESGAEDFDDLWRLDYDAPDQPSWERVQAEGGPPGARAGHSAVWDEAGSRLLVYGGTRTQGGDVAYLADAWALSVGVEQPGRKIFLPMAFNGEAEGGR